MPLNTQITRGGKPLKLRWSDFHVAAMIQAVSYDSGQGPYADMPGFISDVDRLMESQGKLGISPDVAWQLTTYGVIGATPLNTGDYTMTKRLVFIDNTDGEELELLPGDVLSMSRSMQ